MAALFRKPSQKSGAKSRAGSKSKSSGRKKASPRTRLSGVTVGLLVLVAILVIGGVGLLKWSRSQPGQAALLSLGSEKMYDDVQAALGQALAEVLPGYEPGPAGDDPTALDWPADQLNPGAHVRCRQVAVGAGPSYWEWQRRITDAVSRAGGRVLWGERLLPTDLRREQLAPSEEYDLLRLDLGVTGKPTHTLVLHRETRPPDLRWSARPGQSRWHKLLAGQGERATVALLIDDWGNNRSEATVAILKLPAPLTMAILPGLPYSRHFALKATDLILPPDDGDRPGAVADARTGGRRQRLDAGCFVEVAVGHRSAELPVRRREIMLHLPMQPQSYPETDPGPRAVLVGMDEIQIAALLDQALASLPRVTGVNNHMGSAATSDPETMAALMRVLQQRDLFFVDSLTSANSVAYGTARAAGVPTIENRIFLDYDNENPGRIEANLDRLVQAAQATGFALGICHPYPATAEVLARRIPDLRAAGVEFVTVSELMALKAAALGTAAE